MTDFGRREFLSAVAGGVVACSNGGVSSDGSVSKYWIDPAFEKSPARPWRKVHLDFHNSHHVRKIAARFDADEFGDRLAEADVNAVVVFAKDMHGYFYYPSQFGPVHPGLDFDLLGQQVEACRKRDIAVYAYYCVTWDHYLARTKKQWLALKRDGTNHLPGPDETPGWTALCLAHKGFVRLVLDHAVEFLKVYELDGPWFDMPWPKGGECWCRECLTQMRAQGMDPNRQADQRMHKHLLYKSFLKRSQDVAQQARPGCQVDFNEQGGYRMAERIEYLDNVDIEALPTAQWGYYYFPTNARHARGFGKTVYGMTGRFQASWADFGGLKLPAQLHTELAQIVAQGARCDIGDQMPPDGRLDKAVYHVIGEAYGRIKKLEPYLEGAAPVTEAALVTGGLPFDKPSTPANYGLVKLLVESRIQFDVVEPDAEWERYNLVVLPDEAAPEHALARRLDAFLASGGAVIANHTSGAWLERHGFHYEGASPYKPAYLVPKMRFTDQIPNYEYALYEGASQWRAAEGSTVLALLGEPAFQRSPERYTSHRQTPFERATDYAAVAWSGKVGLFGFPLGTSYYNHGYWIYRQAFRRVLKAILPAQLVESNAPLSTEVTLTRQPNRWLVHVVNFSALRRTPQHPDFYEDPIPLTNVRVRLNVPLERIRVRAVEADLSLPTRIADTGVEVEIPRVGIHEIVAFERA